jgi:hypothetical protein
VFVGWWRSGVGGVGHNGSLFRLSARE